VVDVSDKAGRYDEKIRRRYTVRWVPYNQAVRFPVGVFEIRFPGNGTIARVRVGNNEVEEFDKFRSILNADDDLENIITWHKERYFRFLPEEALDELKHTFRVELVGGSPRTIAEANRLAGRMLYEAARERGWHKLTKREQRKIGLEGQWHHDVVYLPMLARAKEASAVGEWTLKASKPLTATLGELTQGALDRADE
jgi:hypothetical protein